MFYESELVDETLNCSICETRFTGAIKLIPDCGESICEQCYGELKTSLNGAKQYNCRVDGCKKLHLMPENGLPDNKHLMRMLNKPRTKKRLSEPAQKLKGLIKHVQEQIKDSRNFDEKKSINSYCDDLATKVEKAFETARSRFDEIEEGLLDEIKGYREDRLKLWTEQSPQSAELATQIESKKDKINTIANQVTDFSSKWIHFFKSIEVLATEKEINAALSLAREYSSKIQAIEDSMKYLAFNQKLAVFRPKLSLHQDVEEWSNDYNLRLIHEYPKETLVGPSPLLTLQGHSDGVNHAIFMPEQPKGRLVSCSQDESIKVWDTVKGVELYELADANCGSINRFVLLPPYWLASCSSHQDHSIKLWDLSKRKVIRSLTGHLKSICDLALLKNGNIASYSLDDSIKIWNPYLAANNLLLTITGHGNTVRLLPLAILPNTNLATCSCSNDEKAECVLRVWKQQDGKLAKIMFTGLQVVTSFLALSNTDVVLGTQSGTIKLMNIESTIVPSFKIKEKAYDSDVVCFVKLSSDFLISCGDDDDGGQMIKIWKLTDLSLVQSLRTDHQDSINSLSLSPDNKFLASASDDNTIKIWTILFGSGVC